MACHSVYNKKTDKNQWNQQKSAETRDLLAKEFFTEEVDAYLTS